MIKVFDDVLIKSFFSWESWWIR